MKRLLAVLALALLAGGAVAEEVKCWGEALYATGGVGVDGREDLLLSLPDYNLRVATAARGGAFLAGAEVEIVDECGIVRVQATLDGPLLVAKLPPGAYQIRIAFGGRPQTRLVTVPRQGVRSEHFFWTAPVGGG